MILTGSIDRDPIEIPGSFDTVALTLLRDTTHFQMNLSDPLSRLEWITLSDHPFVIHVGKSRRAFQVSLFHQLHCVHVMEEAFLRGEYHGLNSHHIQHCLNYLRQLFLCSADDTLEDGDFELDFEDRNGGTKICRDWEAVDFFVRQDLARWHQDNSK
ncbi:hypothetical protein BDN70DRAFT_594703 [Pholiota conissans]|uniref:Uncharacterized protein n=1 Tax=Pholiota conissans TaxID=109636 RepID=A0A9P6D2K4_9AGAR|nr:hypothetical protein BDN70DRAFT_594703 [Pholiota conissans]